MFRSYVNVRQIELGFDPADVVTLEIDSQRPGLEHRTNGTRASDSCGQLA